MDYSEVVVTNDKGDVFIGGNFASSSLSFDGITVNNYGTNSFDVFVAKYSSSGQIRWAKSAGGNSNDYIENMVIGANGLPVVIGEYQSPSIEFNLKTLNNSGDNDVFITNEIGSNGMPVPQICAVTVDSASLYNLIYWDKTPYNNVGRYIIYREITSNVYKPVASVHADSLSMCTDTARFMYGLSTGDPNVGTYRYKIQIQDTVGNYSMLSPFHNTIYIVDNLSGQFTWNPGYTIEGSGNPVNSYVLMRDADGTGNWQPLSSVTGNQNTIADPNYSNYPLGKWRVEVSWGIACEATRAGIITTRSNIKHSALSTNISNAGISFGMELYPNPASDVLSVQYPAGLNNGQLQVFNSLGQMVYNEMLKSNKSISGTIINQLNVSEFEKGIYIIRIQSEKGSAFRRITIQ